MSRNLRAANESSMKASGGVGGPPLASEVGARLAYAHVAAELRDAPRMGAEDQIRAARVSLMRSHGPKYGPRADPGPADDVRCRPGAEKVPQMRGFSEEPTGGLEPPTPSLRVMCSTS